jgi:hypothetical protein
VSDINFLPKSYLQAQERYARMWREGMVVILAGALLVGWYLYELAQTQVLNQQVIQAKADVQKVQDQITLFRKLQLERKGLIRQLRVHRELTQPLAHTAVLGAIGQIMPTSIGLTDMSITTLPPQPPKPAPPEKRKSGSGGSPAKADKKAEEEALTMPKVPPLRIELIGLAPNDVEIADFMARLSDHVLFTDVKLLYSKPVETQDLIAREFRIDMQVPLDREYREPEAQTESASAAVEQGEVAHAR